jgi:hypothetical protein
MHASQFKEMSRLLPFTQVGLQSQRGFPLTRHIVTSFPSDGFGEQPTMSPIGAFETCQRSLKISAYRGRPEVIGARSE